MRKITKAPSFTPEGVLVPAGTIVEVENFNEADKEGKNDEAFFDDVPSDYTPPPPVVVAAIGPTGPQPTQPQTIPPGSMQTLGGYTDGDGRRLIAEGSAEALQVEEGGPSTVAGEGGSSGTAEPSPLDQSVDKLTAYLETVNDPAEITRLREQETGGKSRSSALAALDARAEALKGGQTALS